MSKRKKQGHGARTAPPVGDVAAEPTSLDPAPEDAEGDADELGADPGAQDPLETTDVSPLHPGAAEGEGAGEEGTVIAAPEGDEEPTQESFVVGQGPEGGPTGPSAGGDGDAEADADEDDEPTHEFALSEEETLEVSFDAVTSPHGLTSPHGATVESSDGTSDESSDDTSDGWEEPTRVAEAQELADLAAQSAAEPGTEGGEPLVVGSETRLESIIESLLFAADRPLNLADLKRLVGERDAKKLIAALGALQERHQHMGIQLAAAAGGWQFRTNPENAVWVAKLVAGRPARLSRAMLETLAIVAYRQPITRPEIDEIRGVDCGPVLKTLLERALIRMIGKKEEVGRPILYGTTPEFLRTFSLKDLSELPTLRQFHELGVAEQAKVDAETPATDKGSAPGDAAAAPAAPASAAAGAGAPRAMPAASNLPEHDTDEEDALLAELDDATASATRATRSAEPPPPPPVPEGPEAAD